MVVVIILLGIVLAGVASATRRADEAKAKTQLATLVSALEQHNTDLGFYPPQSDPNYQIDSAFMTSVSASNRLGNYLKIVDPPFNNSEIDPWGNRWYYKSPGTINTLTFDLASLGLDTAAGDAGIIYSATQGAIDSDDITNWKR
jgi:type II secretory pathway pseudopilin PulG